MSMLKEVSFGTYYFEKAMMFWNSMLINGILCSIESVYGLTNAHTEQLELCDRILMKKYMNSKIKDAALKYLSTLKSKHSKSEGLSVTDQMQSYLISSELSLREKHLMFRLRTRTYQCRANYKNQYGSNLACLICGNEDDQIHLLQCKKITDGVDLEGVQYSDLFSSVDKQVKIAEENNIKPRQYYEKIFHHWKPGASLLKPHMQFFFVYDYG